MLAALDGFLLGGSLIVAIGAQNAFVIRQGLIGRFVFWICLFCAVSDAILIWGGVFGLTALTDIIPLFIPFMTYGGVVFLLWFGMSAFRRALKPRALSSEDRDVPSLRLALLTCAGFTWLNPHVYLDTVILLGSVANARPLEERGVFALGASLASFSWFFAIGLGAMVLKPWLDRPRVWQFIDGVIALIMVMLAAKLFLATDLGSVPTHFE